MIFVAAIVHRISLVRTAVYTVFLNLITVYITVLKLNISPAKADLTFKARADHTTRADGLRVVMEPRYPESSVGEK